MKRRLAVLLACLCALLFSSAPCFADIALRPVVGKAPLELLPAQGELEARFTVENRGTEAVEIEELGFREGSETAPLVPAGLKASFADGSRRATLSPGASREAVVRWSVPKEPRVRQLYGHVQVAAHGASPKYIGFHADLDRSGGLLDHPLSLAILSPLLGALGLAF